MGGHSHRLSTIKLLALLAGFGLITGVMLAVTSYDDVVRMYRTVKHTRLEEIEFRAKTEIERLKFEFLALFDDNPNNLPVIDLLIEPAEIREIEALVQRIGPQGNLQKHHRRWAPVTVIQGDKKYTAKIRIRGDQSIHWINKKKSWRLKFKKNNLFERRRSIDLIIPKDKFLEVEKAAYVAARKLGLLVPDAGFMLVRQNRVDMGLYFWTEKLDKYLLERLGRPTGEIFGGSDIGFDPIDRLAGASGVGISMTSNPAAYKTFVHKDDSEVTLIAQRQWGDFLSLLNTNDAARIDAEIESYLDIRKFADWVALVLAFGNSHALSQDNVRWFYDPTTGLVEPILWDVQLYAAPPMDILKTEGNYLIDGLLKSAKVRRAVNEGIRRIAFEENDFILNALKSTYEEIRPYVYRGVEPVDMAMPGVGGFTLERLHQTHENRHAMLAGNLKRLRDFVTLQRVFVVPKFVESADGGTLELEITPQGATPVALRRVDIRPVETFGDQIGNARIELVDPNGNATPVSALSSERTPAAWSFTLPDLELLLPMDGNMTWGDKAKWRLRFTLESKTADTGLQSWTPASVTVDFANTLTGESLPANFVRTSRVEADLSKTMKFLHRREVTEVAIKPYTPPAAAPGAAGKPVNAFIKASGLPLTVEGKVLTLSAGRHEINQHLVIPRGYTLRVQAGTHLLFGPDINFLTYAPVQFEGTASAPIVIDRLVPESPWGIFGVVTAGGPSSLRHVVAQGGGSGSQSGFKGIHFSGQMNFYSADVDIADTVISGSDAEDALNIKNARFSIHRSVISENASDGFDGDWVTGEIAETIFHRSANDGLDVSGSKILIRDSLFTAQGDKAISAGEQSTVDVINSRIEGSKFGLTSKDLSTVTAYAVVISGNKQGLAAYRKKPIFHGGTIVMRGGLLWNNAETFLIDQESKVILDGVGMDHAPTHGAVTAIDLRVGNIADLYRPDRFGNPQPVAAASLPTGFKAGPRTKGETVLKSPVPDLSEHPLGLLRPLEITP